MKKLKITLFLFFVLTVFGIIKVNSAGISTDELNKKVDGLLSQMTIEEKIGQMTQITAQAVTKQKGTVDQDWELDEEKLEEAITTYHVGSLLNVYDKALTPEEWQKFIRKIHHITEEKTRLKIPVIYGIDAIHGANYTVGATLFPQSIGMAATWNPELVKKEGEITAIEMRASGIPWNFNPVLGVGVNPLWPRLWETYGEDPYTASIMGISYIKGQEGADNDVSHNKKVASCMKHYLGYSAPLSGKDRTPAWIPDRVLRELFLPPFEAAVKAGSHTLMVNSSEINGIPVHCNYFLLTELLRNELGFEGLIVTDWYDILNLYEREKVASSPKEAVKMAVNAGIDMSMVPFDYSFFEDLLLLVQEGEVSEERIDHAVRRILKLKYKLGLFEDPNPSANLVSQIGSEEFTKINLQAARESITLLKNADQVLPLSKNSKVLVTGPNANLLSSLSGGWSITWQGNEEKLYPQEKNTILEAIQNKIGRDKVSFVPGSDFDKIIDIGEAERAAENTDAIIICAGEFPYCETPGNIDDLSLPQAQIDLIHSMIATKKPVIVVLVEGRPRLINKFADDVQGILMAYLPGLEGGNAISDVIFGDFNPCGKLPITYPRYAHSLLNYNHKYSEVTEPNHYNPQFPFGFGLSYTTFEYSEIKLSRKKISKNSSIKVSVLVKNTGQREGREIVHLYISDMVRSVTPPVKELKGFQSVFLKPGESKSVSFEIGVEDLSFIGLDHKRVTERGEFEVSIGELKSKFYY
jgi:beta-glucosidase